MPKKTTKQVIDEQFEYVIDVCRAAIHSGDEIPKHHVQRFLEFLVSTGEVEKAAGIRRLLDTASRTVTATAKRLTRSRFNVPGEGLTRAVRPPVDKETAAPLADILWPEDLPGAPPILPKELQQLLENFIKEWDHADALKLVGVSPTRSALIYGAPGTGKTHLALWIAKQLHLPVVVARLDGMISSFLGTTSRNIGNLFDFVERYQCVLLLDEFDAVAKLRDDPHEMGEIKRVVNTILQRLDLRRETGVTIGITNHEQLLDPAVWRRFQIQIRMPNPTLEGRISILRRYLKPFDLGEPEEKFLAWVCGDMTGADIESLVQSFKRLKVISSERELTLIDLCRLTVDMHPDRVDESRRKILAMGDASAAKAIASSPEADGDVQSLGVVFGKSRSTIRRWLEG